MARHAAGMTVKVRIACLDVRDQALEELCLLPRAQPVHGASLRTVHRSEGVERGCQSPLVTQAMKESPDHQLAEQEVLRSWALFPQHTTQARGTERQTHSQEHAQSGG